MNVHYDLLGLLSQLKSLFASFKTFPTLTAPFALSVFVAVFGENAVGDSADVAGRAGAGGHLHCPCSSS